MPHFTKLLSAIAAVVVFGFASQAQAQEIVVGHTPPLFANYYTQGMANQATAEMYVAPVPVPQWVGHTYYTYQPLYPHELMFAHTHKYHNYYDNGRGLNSTKVRYSVAPLRTTLRSMYPMIPRP